LGAGAAFQAREDDKWVNGFQWYRLPASKNQIWVEPRRWNAVYDEWCLDSGLFPEIRKIPDKDQWFFDLPGTLPPIAPAQYDKDTYTGAGAHRGAGTHTQLPQRANSGTGRVAGQLGRAAGKGHHQRVGQRRDQDQNSCHQA